MCINLFILIPQFSHKLFDSSHLNVSVNVSELIEIINQRINRKECSVSFQISLVQPDWVYMLCVCPISNVSSGIRRDVDLHVSI